MHNEAGTNPKPTDGHCLTLSAAEEKKARGRLFQNLKLCWPRIFPENAKVAARDYSEMIPAFCSYAQDLFDGYMNASDLTAIEFQPHVEAIQSAIINRIAPEPMVGLSWGVFRYTGSGKNTYPPRNLGRGWWAIRRASNVISRAAVL
jgi:hypothetical protein